MLRMTFPTVIETPLRLESVTRDPFGDVPLSAPVTVAQADAVPFIAARDRRS
jgi:hypothetical protein